MTFVGVPSSDSLENMEAFVTRHELTAMRHAVDLDRDVWAAFGVPGQPSWAFVTPEGDVTTHIGPLQGEGLTDAVLRLLDG